MRSFIRLIETYNSHIRHLRDYLKDTDFDPYHYWWAVCEWAERNDMFDVFSDITGNQIEDADQLRDEDPEIFFDLEPEDQKEAAEFAVDYVMQNDPAEASSKEHMSMNGRNVLPNSTWLVHFTDDPDGIARNGFTIGTDDMTRLGLTTWYRNESKPGGYNFAFVAGSRYASYASGNYGRGKYGKHAVMFQSAGVHVSHHGDQEDQVIFWGPDVKPRDIIVLNHYDDWSVHAKTTGNTLFSGDFEKCVSWVIKNFAQYRKALTGF